MSECKLPQVIVAAGRVSHVQDTTVLSSLRSRTLCAASWQSCTQSSSARTLQNLSRQSAEWLCRVPVTAKIRLLPSLATTISLAKRLEVCCCECVGGECTVDCELCNQAAGISVLTVHGRTKEEKKTEVGLCDWCAHQASLDCTHTHVSALRDAVMAIKKVMNIPVVLNGGIADYADYERYSSNIIGIRADCGRRAMRDTQVDGVMTSEAVLENPALFR